MMSKTRLADVADTMPHMVASRIDSRDLEALVTLPDGVVTIDLLAASARHANGEILRLALVTHLVEWLAERLAIGKLGRSDLTQAELSIAIQTDRVAADRTKIVPFELTSTATFAADGQVFTSKPAFALRWYDRQSGRITD